MCVEAGSAVSMTRSWATPSHVGRSQDWQSPSAAAMKPSTNGWSGTGRSVFHYLTKWMHLLSGGLRHGQLQICSVGRRAGTEIFPSLCPQARWRLLEDEHRSLKTARPAGLHDASDGYITLLGETQHALATIQDHPEGDDLTPAIETLSALCQHKDWTTWPCGPLFDGGTPLPINWRQSTDIRLLEEEARRHGLAALLLASRYLDRPTAHRLAFRELGLAIGRARCRSSPDDQRQQLVRILLIAQDHRVPSAIWSLGEHIIGVWLPQANHQDESWRAHEDINDVMLATALIPNMVLSVGDGAHTDAR